jgi:hypothetical protein
MKAISILASLAVAAPCMSGEFTNQYATITMMSGKTYSNCQPSRLEGVNLVIFHAKGIAVVPVNDLPTEVYFDLKLDRAIALPKALEPPKKTEDFLAFNTVFRKTPGRTASGEYDYWFEVHNFSDRSFVGTVQIRAVHPEKGRSEGVAEVPLYVKKGLSTFSLNSERPLSDSGANQFEIVLIDDGGAVVFTTRAYMKTIPE